MNKNLINSNGEETQRDKMQNQENRKKIIHPVEPSTEKNASKKNVIRRVKPSVEKNMKRENEIDRMESWTQKNTDSEKKIHPVELSEERSMNREKELHRMESWTPKDANTVDGYSKSNRQTFPMNNASNAFTTSNGHASTQNQSRDRDIKVKNPSNMGSALYVLAALLIVAWAVGFFYYNVGATIHILLVLALLSVLVKIAQVRSY